MKFKKLKLDKWLKISERSVKFLLPVFWESQYFCNCFVRYIRAKLVQRVIKLIKIKGMMLL